MMKELDLSALQQPELKMTLPDKTVLHVQLPELQLVERLMSAAPELRSVADAQDARAVKALFDLAADLLSNNAECRQLTGEDLRDKHGVRFSHLIHIFSAYVNFIDEVQGLKN